MGRLVRPAQETPLTYLLLQATEAGPEALRETWRLLDVPALWVIALVLVPACGSVFQKIPRHLQHSLEKMS